MMICGTVSAILATSAFRAFGHRPSVHGSLDQSRTSFAAHSPCTQSDWDVSKCPCQFTRLEACQKCYQAFRDKASETSGSSILKETFCADCLKVCKGPKVAKGRDTKGRDTMAAFWTNSDVNVAKYMNDQRVETLEVATGTPRDCFEGMFWSVKQGCQSRSYDGVIWKDMAAMYDMYSVALAQDMAVAASSGTRMYLGVAVQESEVERLQSNEAEAQNEIVESLKRKTFFAKELPAYLEGIAEEKNKNSNQPNPLEVMVVDPKSRGGDSKLKDVFDRLSVTISDAINQEAAKLVGSAVASEIQQDEFEGAANFMAKLNKIKMSL
eukprot:TRINITY_DN23607_c0_g2_i1.p1 TRINITY_DN23607_c0_g2~~TRINITY_DN23607_c0_g2_i1.p1  ORF type:complete len:324 (-),score=24.80 TRINITY_DN23607_c0_g2_i1:226-1197(-)